MKGDGAHKSASFLSATPRAFLSLADQVGGKMALVDGKCRWLAGNGVGMHGLSIRRHPLHISNIARPTRERSGGAADGCVGQWLLQQPGLEHFHSRFLIAALREQRVRLLLELGLPCLGQWQSGLSTYSGNSSERQCLEEQDRWQEEERSQ